MIILNKWFEKQGVCFLKKAGLKQGDTVLDCFCGEGNYSIPASQVVGSTGSVYSLDRDSYKLDKLEKARIKKSINNISIIRKEFTDRLYFSDSFFDSVLLYDIFWYYPPEDKTFERLLKELHRVLKDKGLLSVYPEHTDSSRVAKKVSGNGFCLVSDFSSMLVHDNSLKTGHIINFRKDVAKKI